MSIPSEKELLGAACHFGHPRSKWNQRMAPFIYGERQSVHIFDLVQTRAHLERMCDELAKLQTEGKTILFVSTKQQSIPFLEGISEALSQPVVTKKWIPGLLTNWPTIRKRLTYYLDLQKSFQTGEVEKYTKKERTSLRKKLAKLDAALSGVAGMTGLPHALFVVDAVRDRVAVREANILSIPVFGICDSNADPDAFHSFVPANDDAVRSVALILATVQEALGGGKPRHPEAKEELEEAVAAA